MGCESIDWIELSQDRDTWKARVTAVINLKEKDHLGD